MRLALCSILCFAQLAFAETSSQRGGAAQSSEQMGTRALSEVNWDWKPDLGSWNIRFRPQWPGHLASINLPARRITVWVRPKHSTERIAATIVHELAHAFDHDYLNSDLRKAWLAARNLPRSTPWYPSSVAYDDYSSGAGDFAECVSWTLQGPADTFRSRLGPPPDGAQQKLIRDWLTSLPKIKTTGK